MKNLFAALAAFQDDCPILVKQTQASSEKYKYVELPVIIETIKPLLKKHKLGFTQPPSGKKLKTIIFHTETGEFIEGKLTIPQSVKLNGMNDFQVLGSALTYLRRYSLCLMLGIVAEKDSDAEGRQDRSRAIPEGASLVPASNATQVTTSSSDNKKKAQNGSSIAPAFSEDHFEKYKSKIQQELNQGVKHDVIVSNIRKKFLMIAPSVEKLIREMKKQLPELTENHELYAGVLKSLEKKNQTVAMLKNYFTISQEMQEKLYEYEAI
jgi:hypothetical protein